MTVTTGQRIATMREKYRLTQAQLSANLGVTRAAISQYESDRTKPRKKVVEKLAEFFNTDPEWFVTGKGKAPNVLDAPLPVHEIHIERLAQPMLERWKRIAADKRIKGEVLESFVRTLAIAPPTPVPLRWFAGVKLSAHDHMVVIIAPNDAGPIWKGDRVLIDTRHRQDEGIALVISDAGPHLVTDGKRADACIIGYVIAYIRVI